jgi:myo-inositol-1(or 4)-monophosphatase
MDMKYVLDVAEEAAKEAGALLKEGLREQKTVDHKSSAVDLVTQYDQAAETVILERLRRHFPDHLFVAEEGGESGRVLNGEEQPFTWYIDPLDGTNNFAHGLPVFAVSLALYEGGRPLVGVIYDPVREECFSAVSGQGATLTTPEATVPLKVSVTDSLLGSLLATGFPYDRHTSPQDNVAQLAAFLKRAQGVRRMGAAALDMAYVAAGRRDGYWEFKLNSWDVAAGLLLIEEAGGRVTGMDGRTADLVGKVNLAASNGRIHEAMLAVLAEVQQT